jgi:hypothetical protein
MGYRRVNQTSSLEVVLHNYHTKETTPIKIPEVKNDSWNKYGFYNWVNGPSDFISCDSEKVLFYDYKSVFFRGEHFLISPKGGIAGLTHKFDELEFYPVSLPPPR